jgi:hypothetical protein
MQLQDFWGVGPKTSALLESQLGVEAAIDAIESADVRTLTATGLSRGRATRILRRAHGGDGMDVLATRDARNVYKHLLSAATEFAVTQDAADRIRLLTPLLDAAEAEARIDDVLAARDAWQTLSGGEQGDVRSTFETYDEGAGGRLAAVEAALSFQDLGLDSGPFARIAGLDAATLRDAADALSKLDDGDVAEGADETLDEERETLAAVEELEGAALDVLEAIRSGGGVTDSEAFREAYVEHVARETGASYGRIRDATPDRPTDAAEFVGESLRELAAELRESVTDREATVAADLEETVADASEEVDAAVSAVGDAAFLLSLARFATTYDLTRPEFVDDGLAVEGSYNLGLLVGDATVQPVEYAIGDHDLGPPSGDLVTVLTGANSGGKTTLLETLCEVVLLAQLGLPVPAERAQVSMFDSVVFHRRHASFNAGVLESTLRSVVPPLTKGDRTLMLVDEFEAITEPGSAANLLHGLVTLTVDRDALGVFVTHLADDLEPLPREARIDGIFAEGLNPDLTLSVDYQPRFGQVGKSTPEFIVSRLVADASDRNERVGFEALAEAVGAEAVQRTLADARWTG